MEAMAGSGFVGSSPMMPNGATGIPGGRPHTFCMAAVALAETGSRWSDRSADEPDLKTFSVRHPPGL